MNHFKGAVSLSEAIKITYDGMSKDEQDKLDSAVRVLFRLPPKTMTWIFTYEDDQPLVADHKGNAICSVFGGTVNEELDRGVLLAAAPSLLAGVRKALDALNQIPRHQLHQGDSYDVAALLDALIKEATGGPL